MNAMQSFKEKLMQHYKDHHFCLMQHYKDLTKEIYNPEDPRTSKSVCVKCHTTRPLSD